MSGVRRSGVHVWRPSVGQRTASVALVAAFLAITVWLAADGDLSVKDTILFFGADLVGVVLLPVVLLRWRMVLDPDVLFLVFLRVRTVEVREIVGARNVAQEGLTFVLRTGDPESFSALGNSLWGHRRRKPTRADLAARTVLCAAAAARGETPPTDFRLPPTYGLKRAMVADGIWSAVVGWFLGS